MTGTQLYHRATIKGSDKAAWNTLAEFRAEVSEQEAVQWSVTLVHAVDEWFDQADLEATAPGIGIRCQVAFGWRSPPRCRCRARVRQPRPPGRVLGFGNPVTSMWGGSSVVGGLVA